MAINFGKFIPSNSNTTSVTSKSIGIDFKKFAPESYQPPQVQTKEVKLPSFLGGGQYNLGSVGELIKTDRAYGGVEAPGEYREHIFPVALGGTSNVDNIKVYGKKLGEKKSAYENQIIDQYQAGKISLGEARGLVLKKYREITGLDPKQGVLANLWGGIKETFAGTTQSIKDIGESIKTTLPKNPPIQIIKDYAKSIYETDKEEIQRVKDYYTTKVGFAEKLSQGIKVLTGGVGVALSPVTALFEAPKNIPILGTISKVATLPFAIGGDIGTVLTDEALNKLPLSTKTKETLREAINEVGALSGQIAIGGAVYIKGKQFLTKKKELVKKFGEKDTNTIIKKAQEKAVFIKKSVETPQAKIDFNKFVPEKGKEVKTAQEILTLPKQKSIEVFEESKVKTSQLAKSVEAKAVEQNLTKGFGDLPEYKQLNMEQQAISAVDYLNKNYESARNIALGLEKPPANITPEAIFIALENKALKSGDIATIRDLATQSTLSSEATAMGQRIRTLAERNPESPIAAIKDLQNVREKAILAKNKNINQIKKVNVDKIKSEIKKTAPKIKTWNAFIDSLKC